MTLTADTTAAATDIPCVEDLKIKAPLGLDMDRAIGLFLRKLDRTSTAWIFDMISRPVGDDGRRAEDS
ncbi:hypothetical protein VTN77DRAFT_7913 [Rasamsonia byssochlamydoides]|uniref:uncharacterized protein n=1 Tax=Rasamsonia byssochlamydoides TaxID=89139 RepID=UPI00374279E2